MKIKKEINLWNLGSGKTRKTIRYIEQLPYWRSFTLAQTSLFDEIQEKALKQHNVTDMLNVIGFNPIGLDKIYESVLRLKND